MLQAHMHTAFNWQMRAEMEDIRAAVSGVIEHIMVWTDPR